MSITKSKKSYTGWCQQIDNARDIAFQQYIKLGEAFFHIQSREYYNEWKKDPLLADLTKEDRACIIDKDDYYKWRWGYTSAHVNHFVKAYQVCEVISLTDVSEKSLPSSEWVARH